MAKRGRDADGDVIMEEDVDLYAPQKDVQAPLSVPPVAAIVRSQVVANDVPSAGVALAEAAQKRATATAGRIQDTRSTKRARSSTGASGPLELVAVKGNPKVKRCTRCNTFVKAGASHDLSQCNARIARKEAAKGMPKPRKNRKYRLTPRRAAVFREAAMDSAR